MQAHVPVALVRGRTAAQQPDGAHAGHHSPRGAAPAQGYPMQVAGRGARGPPPVLGEEGLAPHGAGASPPRARRAAPVVGRRRRGGAGLAPVRSYLTPSPRRHCIPA
jgi:hypothetical protein